MIHLRLKGGLIMEDISKDKFTSFFTNPNEELICVLDNNYAINFLTHGMLTKGFTVLSDKRVYFKGKNYTRMGKKFYTTTEERIVDVKDITGTGFIYNKSHGIWFVGVGILVYFFMKLIAHVTSPYLEMPQWLLLVMLIAMESVVIYNYFENKRILFEITFASGSILFNTAWLKKNEAQEFQRKIGILKDTHNSIYEDFLNQKLITKEEFEILKKE